MYISHIHDGAELAQKTRTYAILASDTAWPGSENVSPGLNPAVLPQNLSADPAWKTWPRAIMYM